MKNETTTTKRPSKISVAIKQDMCAVIRMGRLANAVAFAKRAHRDAVIHPRMISRRQIHQATFLLAGYMYEATLLIDDLKERYSMTNAFSDLLVFRSVIGQHIELLTAFNFSTAFHQDGRCRKVEEELDIEHFDINALAVACHSIGDDVNFVHYPVVMKFDTALCAKQLAAHYNRDQFLTFIKAELPYFAERFLSAANTFITRTSRRLEFRSRKLKAK